MCQSLRQGLANVELEAIESQADQRARVAAEKEENYREILGIEESNSKVEERDNSKEEKGTDKSQAEITSVDETTSSGIYAESKQESRSDFIISPELTEFLELAEDPVKRTLHLMDKLSE